MIAAKKQRYWMSLCSVDSWFDDILRGKIDEHLPDEGGSLESNLEKEELSLINYQKKLFNIGSTR